MFYQLPHVPISPISSIDPLLDLFLEEFPTSISEHPPLVSEFPPSISDVPSHACDEPPAPIIDMPIDTASAMDPVGPSDSHALRRSHPLSKYLRLFVRLPLTLWQQAMKEELDALHKTRIWDLVDLPSEKSAIGYKWVYKIQTWSDDTVDCYKACLVAKGFTQEYEIDYEETIALVALLSSVRTLIAISAARKWLLFQMDVKILFLLVNS